MKPSKRNQARYEAALCKREAGPPKVSKYAAKRRPEVDTGQGQARTTAPHGVTMEKGS